MPFFEKKKSFEKQVKSRVGVSQKNTYEHLMVSQQPA
jgi:hypothetical protein